MKKKKYGLLTILFFIVGLIIYLSGLMLLFGTGFNKGSLVSVLFKGITLTDEVILKLKITGTILFVIGFIIFMIAIVLLYKNDKIQDNNYNLIIEGKADVVTIIIMTYVMIFMLVVCLLYNQYIGALLFGICIVVQSIVNWALISYFNKKHKKK
jgi:hypothetical protein